MAAQDLTGLRFTRLVALEKIAGQYKWLCKCDCGRLKTVNSTDLKRGGTKSCGCLAREMRSAQLKAQGTKHGAYGTPEYHIWAGILQRCNNPKSPSYATYGGVGIKVCDKWLSYEAFIKDMGLRPSSGHSVDRIDGKLGYSPENCRCATDYEQTRNTKRNRNFEIDGVVKCAKDWADQYGIKVCTVYQRLNRGKTIQAALGIVK